MLKNNSAYRCIVGWIFLIKFPRNMGIGIFTLFSVIFIYESKVHITVFRFWTESFRFHSSIRPLITNIQLHYHFHRKESQKEDTVRNSEWKRSNLSVYEIVSHDSRVRGYINEFVTLLSGFRSLLLRSSFLYLALRLASSYIPPPLSVASPRRAVRNWRSFRSRLHRHHRQSW